jgi:hypothetical protein
MRGPADVDAFWYGEGMDDNKLRIVAVALVSFVVGAALGGFVAHLATPICHSDPTHQRNDLLAGYALMLSTLEDESQVYKLGLLKRITFDAPPEKISSIMAQASEAATNTLEELERYRQLEPRITQLPETDGFGTDFHAAMKEDSTKILWSIRPSSRSA